VLSGGNIDPLLLGKVIRHGMASAGRYLNLHVTIPDSPGGLARLLTGLAHTVEEEVAMRRGVEADRAQPRTTARWVTCITVGVVAALLVFDRAYIAPFGTAEGQLVLALVGGLFAAAFAWMHRLTSTTPGHRFLPKGRDSPATTGRPPTGVTG